MKSKLEYIWLDGCAPTQGLRSKTQVRDNFGGTLEECPMWCFDGSSTQQASGDDSDCLLKPVAIYPDPDRDSSYLVMTEVLNSDGSPHITMAAPLLRMTTRIFGSVSSKSIFFGIPRLIFLLVSQLVASLDRRAHIIVQSAPIIHSAVTA
jgi:hypothetical protein